MLIGIPKESRANDPRVALSPKTAEALLALGFDVAIEQGAGALAGFDDAAYSTAGAAVVDAATAWQADIVLKVHAPEMRSEGSENGGEDSESGDENDEIARLKNGATVISFVYPAQNSALLDALAAKKITLLAMDMVPRISRAQSLDALSAFSNIAGYRAVVEAAAAFGRFFGGQMTAAGNVPPAKVLVIGAGVAGLSAIGAAGNLGAIVRAFDARPETREQVQSMDAEFLSVEAEAEAETAGSSDGYAREMSDAFNAAAEKLYAKQAQEVDIIITTALIPGKPAPRLLTKEIVDTMKRGSVVVDLAAANGGNCAYTMADEKITTANGVQVIGYTDMPARLPGQASALYSVTLLNLLKLLCPQKDGAIHFDFDDVVQRTMTVLHKGEMMYPPPPVQVSAQPAPAAAASAESQAAQAAPAPPPKPNKFWLPLLSAIGVALFVLVSAVAPPDFVSHFTVFLLACVAGYYVVWNVTHALHTPLMSVTNAISGIIIIGALLQVGSDDGLIKALAFVAVLIASINIFGGFAVTRRMLSMFRRKE